MTPSPFHRLPAGHHQHPPDCLCRAHERGEWAGYDPRSGEVAELGSVREHFMRREIEAEIGTCFRRRLGRVDGQRARLIHEGLVDSLGSPRAMRTSSPQPPVISRSHS